MLFLAFSERHAALYTKIFAPTARKVLVLGQSVRGVWWAKLWSAQKCRKQGGTSSLLLTWGLLINISTDDSTPMRLIQCIASVQQQCFSQNSECQLFKSSELRPHFWRFQTILFIFHLEKIDTKKYVARLKFKIVTLKSKLKNIVEQQLDADRYHRARRVALRHGDVMQILREPL